MAKAKTKAVETGPITPRTFRFLRELARHNEREWFNANKQRYFDEVRDPVLAFIAGLAPALAKVAPHIVADPSPVGGSLFRVYRDTRFSRDKSPYKTHAGMSFGHVDGRDAPAPGFYLHLEPRACFASAGMWRPATETLGRVRDAIVAQPERWKRATRGRGRELDQGRARLKRPPRGYDPDHPLIEDLKFKGFTMSARFADREVCAPDFTRRFVGFARSTAPLMRFLAEAQDLEW